MEVLRSGCVILFHCIPPISETPIILDLYSPQSIKGRALEEEIQALCRKGAVEPSPPTPGYYSCMFVVTKASGGCRPVINISDRPERHIPSGADSPIELQVPQVHNWREGLAVSGPLVRSVHGASVVGSLERSDIFSGPSVRSCSNGVFG